MNPALVSVVVCVGIALVIAAVAMIVRDLVSRRSHIQERLTNGNGKEPVSIGFSADAIVLPGEVERRPGWLTRLVEGTGLDITPQAGLMTAVAGGVAAGAVVILWRDDPLAGSVGMLLGMFLVFALFAWRGSWRRRAILVQLPESMDYLARAVRAGKSVDQGMAMVGDTAQGPLAVELRRCARQIEMGLSLDSAIRGFLRRVPLVEVRILATALLVQRQTGGNLPTTLERLAAVFRDRLNYYRHLRAATAVTRGSVVVIAGAGVVAMAYALIWQPDYIKTALEQPAGWWLIGAAIVMQLVGLLLIAVLLKSDY